MKFMIAFAFMMFLNVLLYMSQFGVNALAAESGDISPTIFNTPAILDSYGAANNTLNGDYADRLPTSETGLLATIGAYLFPFQVMLGWVQSLSTLITALFLAFPNFLVAMGLPAVAAFSLGALWHAITLMMVVLEVIK